MTRMPGKRVQFDNELWKAIQVVMHTDKSSFKEHADEAFTDLLKKHSSRSG
jgi:hypothetical protein